MEERSENKSSRFAKLEDYQRAHGCISFYKNEPVYVSCLPKIYAANMMDSQARKKIAERIHADDPDWDTRSVKLGWVNYYKGSYRDSPRSYYLNRESSRTWQVGIASSNTSFWSLEGGTIRHQRMNLVCPETFEMLREEYPPIQLVLSLIRNDGNSIGISKDFCIYKHAGVTKLFFRLAEVGRLDEQRGKFNFHSVNNVSLIHKRFIKSFGEDYA